MSTAKEILKKLSEGNDPTGINFHYIAASCRNFDRYMDRASGTAYSRIATDLADEFGEPAITALITCYSKESLRDHYIEGEEEVTSLVKQWDKIIAYLKDKKYLAY